MEDSKCIKPEQITRSWLAITIKKFRNNIRRENIGSVQQIMCSCEDFVQVKFGGSYLGKL